MKPDMFRKPVTILVGVGFPAEVHSVMDAYRHLVEWPTSFRDTAHTPRPESMPDGASW
jgi:hypothetical protein